MVAKISVGSSLYGALAYNESKVDIDVGKLLRGNKIIENENGEIDMHSTMQTFNLYLMNNDKTKKPIVHISLNPHPDDRLSDRQLIIIAQEYMDKMGYGEQPYVIYKHDDIKRGHIHIVTINVDSTGKKISDSNNFHKNKKVCREIEEKYGLHKAERQRKAETFDFRKVDIEKGDIKTQIGNIIKPIAATYHFQSFYEYRTLLAQYNIWVEEAKGVRDGHSYAGLIYYAMNDKGEKASNPFKSSLYGKSVGYVAINEKVEHNKKLVRDKKLNRQTAAKVREALRGSVDRDSFIDRLRAQNIDVVFRENEAGRLYGVTFIDHDNHCIFNGSRLGGEFSANALTEWFANPTPHDKNEEQEEELRPNPTPNPTEPTPHEQEEEEQQQPIEPSPHESEDEREEEQEQDNNEPTPTQQPDEQQQSDNYYFDDDFSFDRSFDLSANNGIDDPEEERFRRAMQRKKRRKGRKM